MVRYQVRYHRAILDSSRRILYPSGAIIDNIDLIPPGQHDRVVVIADVEQPEVIKGQLEPDDDEEEPE